MSILEYAKMIVQLYLSKGQIPVKLAVSMFALMRETQLALSDGRWTLGEQFVVLGKYDAMMAEGRTLIKSIPISAPE